MRRLNDDIGVKPVAFLPRQQCVRALDGRLHPRRAHREKPPASIHGGAQQTPLVVSEQEAQNARIGENEELVAHEAIDRAFPGRLAIERHHLIDAEIFFQRFPQPHGIKMLKVFLRDPHVTGWNRQQQPTTGA